MQGLAPALRPGRQRRKTRSANPALHPREILIHTATIDQRRVQHRQGNVQGCAAPAYVFEPGLDFLDHGAFSRVGRIPLDLDAGSADGDQAFQGVPPVRQVQLQHFAGESDRAAGQQGGVTTFRQPAQERADLRRTAATQSLDRRVVLFRLVPRYGHNISAGLQKPGQRKKSDLAGCSEDDNGWLHAARVIRLKATMGNVSR